MTNEIHWSKRGVIQGEVVANEYVKCVETDCACTRQRVWFVFRDRVVDGEMYRCSYKALPAQAVAKARALLTAR